jgi:alanine racemase
LSSGRPLARIDLGAIVHNYGEVRKLVGPWVDIIAMVKADAYGHGAHEVVVALAEAGCNRFGVASLDEVADLAEGADPGAFDPTQLIVFGGILPTDADYAVSIGAEIVAFDRDVLSALDAAAADQKRTVHVHLHIDTGMHRLGARVDEAADLLRFVRALDHVETAAICTHLAKAEAIDDRATDSQLAAFDTACKSAGELSRHVANSAAILARSDTHMSAVRPGLMLYGLAPTAELGAKADLRPAMTLDAPIIRVAEVGPEEGIGYGHTHWTDRATEVATVRCGYADGYPRILSNLGPVVIHGRRYPVIGRVCMDHIMVDVTGAADVSVGDRAVLWGEDPPVTEIADLAGTIGYELVSRVGTRVGRVHKTI